MSVLLLAILVFEAIIIFVFNGRNLISPSFIACCVFIFSTAVFIMGGRYFDHDIRFNTVAVVALAVFAIFVGELLVNSTTRDKKFVRLKAKGTSLVLPQYACYILEAFVLVVGVLYFISVYKYSLKVGNTAGNYFGMAKYVRNDGGYEKGIFIGQTSLLSECIVCFFIYSFFYNKIVTGKFFIRYLWIIPAYAIHVFANDNRIELLKVIVMLLLIVIFLMKQSAGWSKKYDVRIIIGVAVILAIYLILFRLLGYRTGVSSNKSAYHNFTQYCSAGLYGLDGFINGEIVAKNTIFAQNTLKAIYGLLRSWGLTEIPKISSFEDFFFYGAGNTNVYTGIKALIQDFTVYGMVIVLVLLGMIVTWLINSLRYIKIGFVRLVLLGYIIYPCVMLPMDWTASTVLQLTTVYFVVYALVVNYCAGIFREKKYDRLVKNALA